MIEDVSRWQHAFRKGDPEGMYQGYTALMRHLEGLYSQLGKLPLRLVDGVAPSGSARVPAAADFAVSGVDGKFQIVIVNPQDIPALTPQIARAQMLAALNRSFAPILHNVQSAKDVNFDLNSGVTDYGVSAQLAYEIQDPNTTKFFRLRSSYDGKNWNAWQIYSSSLTCGPAGVYSGLLSSPATVLLNSTAMTTDGSIAVSQHGTTTQIDVAAKTWNVGPEQISYLGGSVDPGAYGKFYIYAVDYQKAGGAVTYLATANFGDLCAQDGIIQFGSITTVNTGGGTGGYGGACCIGAVRVRMFDGERKPVSQLQRDDELRAPDGGKEVIQRDPEIVAAQPCFRFIAGDVCFGGASADELVRSNGHWVRLVDLAIGDTVDTFSGARVVSEKEFLGEAAVYRLTLDRTKRYYGDDVILHNIKIGP